MIKIVSILGISTIAAMYFMKGSDGNSSHFLGSGTNWVSAIPFFGGEEQRPELRPIPTNMVFGFGQTSKVNVRLRSHLIENGLLEPSHRSGKQFDDHLANAVKKFQRKHGLKSTGLPQAKMVHLLNERAKRRIKSFRTRDAHISLRGQTNTEFEKYRQKLKQIVSDGGWPILRGRPGFGEKSKRVAILRKRLQLSGDLVSKTEHDLFDQEAFRAVQLFQWRHGLHPDGVIGSQTEQELRASASMRLRQLESSYERIQHIRDQIDGRYVLTNIPAATVSAVNGDGLDQLRMKAAVGREARRTPGMVEYIDSVTFNPTWTVPRSILNADKAPRARVDPSYLDRSGFYVIDSSGQRVRASEVNWSLPNLPFTLVQKPGPSNALGRIRIDMPNSQAIFLHDTPARDLFERDLYRRFASSGCVRLESPAKLAAWLLYDDAEPKTVQKLRKKYIKSTTKTRKKRLQKKVPVFLLYADAWISNGKLHFRRDTYGLSRQTVYINPESGVNDG